ncbi:unnamed protein product [Notodromas monacha]|uniref:Uncharacterized protein n=1 Tax=Notodromas monacha TaxID=399045 RepID=A0A7R9BUQ4_9CRUS|nr:unnamed protein product [Notodromas monacha]CAG0920492.1 unnamed protein product [Notodromas monacha]
MSKELLKTLKSKLQTLKLPASEGSKENGWQRSNSNESPSPSRSQCSSAHNSETVSRFTTPRRLSKALSHASSQASKCTRLKREYGLETGAWVWDHESKTITFYTDHHLVAWDMPSTSRPSQLQQQQQQQQQQRSAGLPSSSLKFRRKEEMLKKISTSGAAQDPAISNRAIRRRGVVTLQDVKAVALLELADGGDLQQVTRHGMRKLVDMEASDKLLLSLINYFQFYQRGVVYKRRFRFERETTHIDSFFDIVTSFLALQWPKQAGNSQLKTLNKLRDQAEIYESTKYLYPFSEDTFGTLDEIFEKSYLVLKAYAMMVGGHNKDQHYRNCKEKLNTLLKKRGEDKRTFERQLNELKPTLESALQMASEDYRKILATGALYVIATEKLAKGSLPKNQYDFLFEYYIRFLSITVWIALERQDYESIQRETDSLFGCVWDPDKFRDPMKIHFKPNMSLNVSRLFIRHEESRSRRGSKTGQIFSVGPEAGKVGIIGQLCQQFNESLERTSKL